MPKLLNNFFIYRLLISSSSLAIFFIAYLSGDYFFFKTATVYTFFASLISLGFSNHIRRNCFFIQTKIFKFFYLGLLTLISSLPFLFDQINLYLNQFNLSYILLGLASSHVLSLIAFDNFIHNSKHGFLYIFLDCLFLLMSSAILIFDYFHKEINFYYMFLIIFCFRVLILSKIQPLNKKHQIFISRQEIMYSMLNAFFASLPMILITSISFNDVSLENEIALWILRLISLFSVLIISYFNYSKSTEIKLDERFLSNFYVYTSSIVFLIFFIFNIYYALEDILIAFLPLLVLFGTWSKQNIQFKLGSIPIFLSNLLLTLFVISLIYFEASSFIYFLGYYIFYGICINTYFRIRVL